MTKVNKIAVVIIPTYNERDNVTKVIPALAKIFKQIKSWNMRVLIVDDTSPDKTYEVVRKLQKKYSFLELVLNKKKAGLGGAYLKGMEHAFNKLNANLIFEFDADLSHDPTKIPQFLEKIDAGADLVLGSRYIPGGSIPQDWGFHRKFMSIVGNLFIRTIMLDNRVKDWTTGYRAIRKKVWQAVHPSLVGERFSGYTFQIGFLHKTLQQNFNVAEVPFHFIDRVIGQSKIGGEYIKNTLLYLFKVRFNDLISSRIFKFLVVGTIGAIIQLGSLEFMRATLMPATEFALQTINFASIELAIIANFLINNSWTFADHKLALKQYPAKFFQFNLTSAGSILIQLIVFFLGVNLIGEIELIKFSFINYTLDTPPIFSAVGILIGLFWNFFAYNKFIWKTKQPKS